MEAVWSLDGSIAAGALVAVVGGEIIGHVLVSLEKLDALSVPGIAPLAVRPDWQDKGIGRALMTEGLHLLNQRGSPLVVVFGNPAYYGRFGFQPSHRAGIRYLPSGADSPHFQVLLLGDGHEVLTVNYVYSWEAPVEGRSEGPTPPETCLRATQPSSYRPAADQVTSAWDRALPGLRRRAGEPVSR